MEYGPTTSLRLTHDWQFNSRGLSLSARDFETKLLNRTGGKPPAAILALPVMAHTGLGNSEQCIARYPVFAYVAVNRDGLDELLGRGLATVENTHHTCEDAREQARRLNEKSYTAYLNKYASGSLSKVHIWKKTDAGTMPAFHISPGANIQDTAATLNKG